MAAFRKIIKLSFYFLIIALISISAPPISYALSNLTNDKEKNYICMNTDPNQNCKKKITLEEGGSSIYDLGEVSKRSKKFKILSTNENVVDVRPLKQNTIVIRAKAVGHSTVVVFDEINSSTVAQIEVDVLSLTTIKDVSNLKRQLDKFFSGQDINVETSLNGIILYGTVTGPEIVEQVLRLTEGFVASLVDPKMVSTNRVIRINTTNNKDDENNEDEKDGDEDENEESNTGKSGPKWKIVNLLKVGGPQQVLLEVKFSEVARDNSMNWSAGLSYYGLGQDFSGKIGGYPIAKQGEHYSNVKRTDAGWIVTDFVNEAANILMKIDNVHLALEFLEGEGLSKTLAEPKVVALSGQEAKFLAGGQFPYVTVTTSANGFPQANTEFKDFGVALKFTPIVQSDGLITLRVAPSVSTISDTIENPIAGTLPFIGIRELETTAQLRDGQTIVLGGLLTEDMNDAINKVPILGDLPILGSLFRSQSFQNKKSDLVVAITVHLVKPVTEGTISYPGEFLKPPNRFEFYLMGRLEGERNASDPSTMSQHYLNTKSAGGLEGNFGHLESGK